MKKLLLLLTLAFTLTANAEDDKTVTLVVSGQGKTQDEAKQAALRSAIEQAFGTFISSKTEILNNKLVKDEIVSVTNGNIQKFEPVSEVQLPDGSYTSTLKATVSVSKLTSFCESKGVEVEFKGALFAANIKTQKLNEDAEYNAILNLCQVSKELLSKSVDFSLKVSEPISFENEIWATPKPSKDDYSIKFEVQYKSNENFKTFNDYFWNTLPKITMNRDEKLNYDKLNKLVYFIFISGNRINVKRKQSQKSEERYSEKEERPIDTLFLRSPNSLLALKNLMIKSNDNLFNFRIMSEIDTIVVKKCCKEKHEKPRTNNIFSDHGYTDQWELTGGYPKAGTIGGFNSGSDLGYLDQYHYYPSPVWKVYFNFIYNSNNHHVLFDDTNYFTSTGKLIFETMDNPYIAESEYCSWLEKSLPIVLYNDTSPMVGVFRYNHILSLSKLEKISKYRIEPWENKTHINKNR